MEANPEIVKVLQGIVLPAVKLLNTLSSAEKEFYAPYMIGGKDAIMKVQVLLFQNLYTPAVITELIKRDACLCKPYLAMSQNKLLQRNANLPEFKRQMIASGNEKLLRDFLEVYSLGAEDEKQLLDYRLEHGKISTEKADEFMRGYFQTKGLKNATLSLLNSKEYQLYWNLYCDSVPVPKGQKLKHKLLSWFH